MDPMHSAKKFKGIPSTPAQGFTPESSMPPPPVPTSLPPPLPLLSSPLTSAQPHTAFLPLFTQMASERGMFVDYPAVFSGPAHAGTWTVKCIVNGVEKGMASGHSKQLAKEEAAKQAFYAMAWAPRG